MKNLILTDNEIKLFMKHGKIKIENFKEENLGPVSYDLTISDTARLIETPSMLHWDSAMTGIKISEPRTIGKIVKIPVAMRFGDSLVFTTEEKITIDSEITGIVYARSSLTKLPILFNIPGLVDPGFSGSLTGVMYNLSGMNITIEKMRICQIVFHRHYKVETDYSKRELSKNQNQSEENALTSRWDKEFR